MRHKLLFAVIFISFIQAFLHSTESPWYLDLNDFSLFVKTGFEISDADIYPRENDTDWIELAPEGREGLLVRPVDLNIPGLPRHRFLSLKTYDVMSFTYAIPFKIIIPDSNAVPGLHLASLGDNWEIFLNGFPVRSSVDMDEDGRIETHHSRRDIYFPIDPSIFRDGDNLLVIHMMCDPSYESNGFHQANPYYFDTYEKISRNNSSLLTFALLVLYLFMGIYHIFLYFSGRNYLYNLFYGLFSADLFLYLFMRTHIIYNLIADTQIVFKIELISLFGILPFVSAFLGLISDNKVNRITKGYSLFSILLAIAVIFTPANVNLDILRIWQISGLTMILYIFLYLICWKFFSSALRQWNRQKSLENGKSAFRIILETLSKTAIGNLFIGGVILGGTAIFDILDSMIFQLDLVMTNYGFIVFTLGSAFILANRFAFMNKQNADLNRTLENKILEVEKASEESRIAEKKYRSLFEGNSDAVLLLSDHFTILDGNDAGMKLLGALKSNLKNFNLFESLSSEDKDTAHSKDLFRLKLNEVLKTGKPTELNLRFAGRMGESKAVRVRLELIQTLSSGRQILFRGVLRQEDALLDHFIGEKIHYKINNSFPLTEDVSRRVTANLSKYMDRGEAEILYIGLREIIINAVEHGNLHITFEEKTRAQAEGRYMELLMDRHNEPQYRDKKVKIETSITADKVMYRISDEGPGFDHKTFLEKTMHQVDATLAHGRGISMAFQLFDSIEYNDKGNQVTLIKSLG